MRTHRRRRSLRPKFQGQLMEQISIGSVIVANRFRHDMGDLAGLAKSIEELGQIHPIVINKDRHLIAGSRRLAAMKLLGRDTIAASVFDLNDIEALKVERDENDQRKEPTISEKVALAVAISETLEGRQLSNLVQNRVGNISHSEEKGRTTDIAAAKVGLGSGKTLEAAQVVIATGVPELVQAMDNKAVTIHAAKDIATLAIDEQKAVDYSDPKQVKNARDRAASRTGRANGTKKDARRKIDGSSTKEHSDQEPKARPDEQRLYEADSSLSAFVLSHRAKMAISQISKKDPNALQCIESIRVALDKQLFLINS